MELQEMKERKHHEVRRDEVKAEIARRLSNSEPVGDSEMSARKLTILNRAQIRALRDELSQLQPRTVRTNRATRRCGAVPLFSK